MEQYQYKIGAVYSIKTDAEKCVAQMRTVGFSANQIYLISPEDFDFESSQKLEPESDETPKEIIKDTLVGAGAGGAVGAAGTAGLGLAGITLFVANPVIASLMIVSYAATTGAVIGAVKSLSVKKSVFDSAIKDILRENHWVVIVHCHDHDEEDRACQLLEKTFADEVLKE